MGLPLDEMGQKARGYGQMSSASVFVIGLSLRNRLLLHLGPMFAS